MIKTGKITAIITHIVQKITQKTNTAKPINDFKA
jgi:hypothetical protein